MAKYPRVSDVVVFHDTKGVAHNALVTCYHGQVDDDGNNVGNVGCVNLVCVTDDERRTDGYGRQTIHESSVPHVSTWDPHGFYWRWPDEAANPYKAPSAT